MEVDLGKAVAEGILTAEQAQKLEALGETQGNGLFYDEDEKIGIVKGYNDIFFSIGIVLATIGVSMIVPDMFVGSALVLLGWGMAEMLRGKYKSVLPMIVTSILVAVGAFLIWEANANFTKVGDYMFIKSIIAFGATLAFYWRFKVPFTLAALCFLGGAGLYFLLVTPWLFAPVVSTDNLEFFTRFYLFVAGASLFFVAMRFDMSDVKRLTRRADCAFWLHVLASAAILHGALSGFLKSSDMQSVILTAFTLVVVLLVSLAIDRRSPIVACLLYVGAAIYYVADKASVLGAGDTIAVTVLILGVMVFITGIYWHELRKIIFGKFVQTSLFLKLPPLR